MQCILVRNVPAKSTNSKLVNRPKESGNEAIKSQQHTHNTSDRQSNRILITC